VVYVPGLNTEIFRVEPLKLYQWLEIIPLLLIPSIAAELTKAYLLKKEQSA
jgi:hypothetical protein